MSVSETGRAAAIEALTDVLAAGLDEDERVAMAASERDFRVPATTAERWQWECSEDDQPLDPDLAVAGGEEYLDHGEHYRVGLRSVEKYPTAFVGPLAHLVIDAEEVRPQDARHIARHDPARTAARTARSPARRGTRRTRSR